MNLRRLASSIVLVTVITGAMATGPTAQAISTVPVVPGPVVPPTPPPPVTPPASTLCTALGSCSSVIMDSPNHFVFTVKCAATESVGTGVRGYFADGNWSTSSLRSVPCTPGATFTFPRTYRGPEVVGHRVSLGSFLPSKFGPYVGAAVPSGGHETGVSTGGFHWD